MAAASGIYTVACGTHDVSIRRREAMAHNCPFAGNSRNQLEEHRDATVTGTPLTVKELEKASDGSIDKPPPDHSDTEPMAVCRVRDRRLGPPKPQPASAARPISVLQHGASAMASKAGRFTAGGRRPLGGSRRPAARRRTPRH